MGWQSREERGSPTLTVAGSHGWTRYSAMRVGTGFLA